MRRTIVLSGGGAGPGPLIQPSLQSSSMASTSGANADQKLIDQFVYFKKEFVTSGLALGIAIPLDIVEDKSASITQFLSCSGPKYVYQIIQTNKENIQLTRSGLSLLITLLILLRRQLPETLQDYNTPNSWYFEKPSYTPEQQWVSNALMKISDLITISSCVVLFITTYNPVVQELILSLLTNLLAVSDDAIAQILQIPSAFSKLNLGGGTSNNSESNTAAGATTGRNASSLKRLNSRISTADISAADTRRGGTSSTMNPRLERSNSRFKFDTGNNASSSEERSSDEVNTCLSYILSVVLMQKNRHLLLAGCADIIITMTKLPSPALCEVIARTPTCLLPLLSTDKNASKNQSSLKHLFTNGASGPEPIPINPLGNRIIDWAGVKILLKFLQRYHTLFKHGKDNLNESGYAFNTPASGGQEEMIISQAVRDEYHYAHNRALVALSTLITGSNAVAKYVYKLPGAHQLLMLASNFYHDHDHHHYPSGGSRGSHDELDNDLPGVIINALNTLQMERQHETRLIQLQQQQQQQQAMLLNNNGGGASESGSNKSLGRPKSSASPSLMDNQQEAFDGPGNSSRSASAGKLSRAGGQRKPNSRNGQRLEPLSVAHSTPLPMSSPPKSQKANQNIQLSNSMSTNFQGNYNVETERYHLYNQNQADDMIRQRSPASPLQYKATRTIQKSTSAPLHAQASHDTLLLSSLEAIDANAKESIMEKRDPRDPNYPTLAQTAALYQQSTVSTASSNPKKSTSSFGDNIAPDGQPQEPQTSPLYGHGLSASRDFFAKVPHQPVLPTRIEAKDVIIEGEDLTRIRQKFKILAESAISQTKTGGKGKIILNIFIIILYNLINYSFNQV